mgnify:CR=1 FL=1|jgi:hypothetical protein
MTDHLSLAPRRRFKCKFVRSSGHLHQDADPSAERVARIAADQRSACLCSREDQRKADQGLYRWKLEKVSCKYDLHAAKGPRRVLDRPRDVLELRERSRNA